MGSTLFIGENSVIYNMLKYLFITMFLVSGVTKILSFNDTLIYFAGITKISLPNLTLLLWILIIVELFIPVLVWMNGLQVKMIFLSILTLLVTFLITNLLFIIQGVENCGCFGAGIQSYPVVGIIKTGILILIVYFLRGSIVSLIWFNIRKIN
jgi:hypothetical protein